MRIGIFAVPLSALLLGLVLTIPSQGQNRPPNANVGKKIANITFKDTAGKSVALHGLKDKKAVVIVFLSFECPVSNSYTQPLSDLARQYAKYDVDFIGLTTNQDETRGQVVKQAKDYDLPFPVYLDKGLVAADALKAEVTPEVFVLDGNFMLRYRGRIDNAYSDRLKKHPQITDHNLKQVLVEVLAGRPVSQPATKAVGCPILREEKVIARDGKVTYHRDVLPILQNHCQTCHRPGEVGPFSLMTYRQAVNWAPDIKSYTQKRLMPPWKPIDGPGFHNERRLSEDDIATLASWVDGGTVAGDPKDAPPPRKFPQGWQLGTPDLILTMPEDFQLGPTGRDVLRCFALPTNLAEDQYVAAVEVRPSNPRIVHHSLLFIDTTGQGRKLEKKEQDKRAAAAAAPQADDHPDEKNLDSGAGYSVAMGVGFVPQGGLSGWAPGQMPRFLPDGVGYYLPKNSDVIMQLHYHRNGRLEKDRTQIGLYFAKKPVERRLQSGVIAGSAGIGILRNFFSIPAGAENFKLDGDLWATQDFTLFSVMPHMHMLGKEIKVTMTPPGGSPRTLVAIKEWDYNWQETYVFKEPMPIKADTRFHVEAIYDNSSKNPNNPFNPPRRVTFGEQTFNEMCFVFLSGISNRQGRNLPMTRDAPKNGL
jgi:peroxiredoxin